MERFWSKAAIGSEDECWEWTGSRHYKGYGKFWLKGCRSAHRVAYELTHGPITDPPLLVMHSCDNPPCVNPTHLSLGTASDNQRDSAAKGRHVSLQGPGSSPASKLTPTQVREIRARREKGALLRVLAKDYGVCKATIGHICSGRNWGSLV